MKLAVIVALQWPGSGAGLLRDLRQDLPDIDQHLRLPNVAQAIVAVDLGDGTRYLGSDLRSGLRSLLVDNADAVVVVLPVIGQRAPVLWYPRPERRPGPMQPPTGIQVHDLPIPTLLDNAASASAKLVEAARRQPWSDGSGHKVRFL